MSVCSVRPRRDNSGVLTAERNALLFEVARRRFVVSYNIRTTSHLDGPSVLWASPLVPKLGSAYAFGNDNDALATCVRVQVPVRLSVLRWRVEVEYDTDRIVAEFSDNPFNQPPDITGGSLSYEIAMRRDVDGRTILNSALRPFDPPPLVDEKPAILTITRNEAVSTTQANFYLPFVVPVFTTAKVDSYKMKCNQGVFQGKYGTYICRMNDIRYQRQLSQGRLYWQVTYEIEIRRIRGFYEYLLDMSWTSIDNVPFRDPATGFPLANQTPMNGRGRALYTARSKLTVSVDNEATLIPISLEDLGTLFPGPKSLDRQEFYIKVDDEVMMVVGYAGDSFVVVRGQQNTTAVSHAFDTLVTMEPYFLKYRPHTTVDFTPLNLPVLP